MMAPVKPLALRNIFSLAFIFNVLSVATATSTDSTPVMNRTECLSEIKRRSNILHADSPEKTLVSCLWQHLATQASQKYGLLPTSSGFTVLLSHPPPSTAGFVKISVQSLSLTRFQLTESTKSAEVAGYIVMSWIDERLKWNTTEYQIEKVLVDFLGPFNIWKPDTKAALGLYVYVPDDGRFLSIVYVNTTVYSNGTVTTSAVFQESIVKTCTFDHKHYPNDKVTCFVYLTAAMFADNTKFEIVNEKGAVHRTWRAISWKINNVYIRSEFDVDAKEQQMLRVFIEAMRVSTTLQIQLAMPMAFSATLILIAPFIRNFKLQLLIKLFTMLLQHMCFEMLVKSTPLLGYGDSTPKVYTFYELTMACTIVGVLFTFIIYMRDNIHSKSPPPHKLTLLADLVNKTVCCYRTSNELKDGEEQTNAVPDWVDHVNVKATVYTNDWRRVYMAANLVLSMLLCILYIFSIILLALI